METAVRTPIEIFSLPQQLLVPLFQRPYVWNEQDQWAPLWSDIRRLTEVRLREPSTNASHFLGAIVLQSGDTQVGSLPQSSIIDGQQRLTTLQLLMDATAAVLKESDLDSLAGQLDSLTHNQANFLRDGSSALKIRHSNKDQAAFDEVMDAEPPVDYSGLKHAGTSLVQAHAYFTAVVSDWIGDEDSEGFAARAEGLVSALIGGLQLVTITLRSVENSQEIFETLNARGTPLTAADLVRNFVFQRMKAEGADMRTAYTELWPFESKFWEKEISVGRYLVSRSSLFLNQWLVSRIGEEVGPQQTFARFKAYVEHGSHQIRELLPVIREQADLYRHWTELAAEPDRRLSVLEMSVYRMQACGIEILKPLWIWLNAPGREVPAEVADQVVSAAESWVMRRLMLRLTSGDLGRVVADLIRVFDKTPVAELGNAISGYLGRLNAASTYWPGDAELTTWLSTENAYRSYRRGRLRVILEAVENLARAGTNQAQIPRRWYPIEHILPQSWERTWPVEDELSAIHRAEHVHRLGNLTLLTTSLNSQVSNGPWAAKRAALEKHDVLLLNRRICEMTIDASWDEDLVDARTASLIANVLGIWSVPEGHEGKVAESRSRIEQRVQLSSLIAAKLVEPGTVLHPRAGMWVDRTAVVRADGTIDVDGTLFDSLSSAGKFVKGGVTNGWYFWCMPDGRRMLDVRASFAG